MPGERDPLWIGLDGGRVLEDGLGVVDVPLLSLKPRTAACPLFAWIVMDGTR